MKDCRRKRILGVGLALLTGFLVAGRAHGQAYNTAQRPAELLVFGGYGYTLPDYGADGQNNSGLVFGVDYDRYLRSRFIPGIEFRGNLNSGAVVTEHSYLGGLRLHTPVGRRFNPYVDFLVGAGYITYKNSTYPPDEGLVLNGGGGVDIDLVRNFKLRADVQDQNWNLGINSVQKPQGGNYTLSPLTVTLGITYRIPFRNWTDQAHE